MWTETEVEKRMSRNPEAPHMQLRCEGPLS
ncbi:MAG: hypothetical protein DDT34_01024 [Firmicutes bacterium]|nr:hypothetical protein [Bacillota bacterium]